MYFLTSRIHARGLRTSCRDQHAGLEPFCEIVSYISMLHTSTDDKLKNAARSVSLRGIVDVDDRIIGLTISA